MTQFLQLHVLTFYPPSNLNRDDLGRPKTAEVGGHPRLRISSQCLKRAWRTSPLFAEALAGHVGTRTKKIGSKLVKPILQEAGIPEKDANEWAVAIAEVFGKVVKEKGKEKIDIQQLAHLSPTEEEAVRDLARRLAEERRAPTGEELHFLRKDHRAADIALFGRMLADKTAYNVDAAAQVSHAFTVNKIALEDDFFTAVDDLNAPGEDLGAGHLDESWFGSGVFYLYLCINRDLLEANLSGDVALAGRTLRALTEAVSRVSPHGKQNSFAARTNAGFIRAEKGETQPRSLALAFLEPLPRGDFLEKAVQELRETQHKLDGAYECAPEKEFEFHPAAGTGKLSELLKFVEEP